MKTLHLVLKGIWYDKIASGQKTSEYRECKAYWNNKLGGWKFPVVRANYEQYKRVVFHRGYTDTTMEFEITAVDITNKPNDLGLDLCWEIKLGQRIK